MLWEIELDVLQYFDRTSLEALQMHSRYLRDTVNRHACSLPMRYIQEVYIEYGAAQIQLRKGSPFDWIRVTSPDDPVLEVLFHRVNKAFVNRLTFSFVQENLHLPYYLKANANALQCQIRMLRFKGTAVEIDYSLVDFLGVHLKPQLYETDMYSASYVEEYTMLFVRNTLRGSIVHLAYELDSAPVCLIPKLFGVDVVETCAITTDADPRPWIAKFIETFEMAPREVEIVRSVTLIHMRFEDVLPLRLDVEPLGRPRRTDVPTPQSAFVKQWQGHWDESDGITTTESTVATLFAFENAKAAKKLEVFAWDIEQSGQWSASHYAFQINVIDL